MHHPVYIRSHIKYSSSAVRFSLTRLQGAPFICKFFETHQMITHLLAACYKIAVFHINNTAFNIIIKDFHLCVGVIHISEVASRCL